VTKRGRPALSPDESSTDVHFRMPDSLYDRASAAAAQDRLSVPDVIRRALARDLVTKTRQTDDDP
jgi:hypothetical protein